MAALLESPSLAAQTLADLLEQLGNVPPERVRIRPAPGTATEKDVLEIEARENRLCELIDGVLVEKGMGFRESIIGVALSTCLRNFVEAGNLGLVTGADGMVRLFPGLVRIPDVAFVSWQRIPGRRVPSDPIPGLVPDLAVEVLSPSNTPAEMARKLREYFQAGVRVVWLIDLNVRAVTVHLSPEQSKVLIESDTLSGDPALPGFQLKLKNLFAELDRQASP